MLQDISKLNLVRVGSYITYSSLKEIGSGLLESFRGIIGEINLSHLESPVVESIDAQLLTLILGQEYCGNTLGITDADLRRLTQIETAFSLRPYEAIFNQPF